jgi:glycogen(starch) synthase
MNVCFVSPEYYPISGGTGAYVYYLSQELQKYGCRIHIVTRSTKDSTEIINGINITYIRSVGNPLIKYLGFARSASRKLEELGEKSAFDVIHVNLPLVPNFALPKKVSNALVCTVHSTWKGESEAIKQEGFLKLNANERFMLEFNSLLRSSEKKLMRRSDALIAVSKYTKKELTEFYGVNEEKIHVVYNGVDVQKFKPNEDKAGLRRKLGFEKEKKIILYVGRFYSRKGLTTLMQAIPKVVQDFKDAEFVLSGGGSKRNEAKLLELAHKLKIEKHVLFVGYFPDETLPDLYAASEIFVLPALYENFPFAILEAQSTGLPVVSTKVGGIPELITENRNGLLIDPAAPEQVADAIIALLQNPKLADELGKRGRQFVEERFAWPLVTNKVLNLYNKVLKAS